MFGTEADLELYDRARHCTVKGELGVTSFLVNYF
jgi:hypothetical protein